MKTYFLLIALCLTLSGCGNMTPSMARPLAAAATAAAIQYAVPPAQRVEVARNTVAASQVYTEFSGGHVPTPSQLNTALERVLPNNPSKALTQAGIISIYTAYYPRFQNAIPATQFDWLTNILLGTGDGAAPFLP